MVWAWGQFVDHDIDFTSDGGESHPINIMPTDPSYAHDSDHMIPIFRKSYITGTGTSITIRGSFETILPPGSMPV